MKTLLVGAGYVGITLLKGWSLGPIDATTTSPERVETLSCYANEVHTLSHKNALTALIPHYDCIIVTVAPKAGASYRETYLETAEIIVTNTKPTAQVIYTSSTSVYGEQESEWVDEASPPNPTSDNGKILAQTEDLYLSLPKATVLRLAGIYGPDRTIAKRAQYFSGKEVGDGNQFTNHIHRDDIVAAINFSIQQQRYGLYNLANDAHPTRKELYDHECQKLGLSLPKWLLGGTSKKAKISNHKIKSAGLIFCHPNLEES